MTTYYSSLFKGTVHVTTKFSDAHHGLDLGNYKVKNKIYSPAKFGTGKVTKIATTDKVGGVTYRDVSTIWYEYPNGWEMVLVHGEPKDQVVKVGQTVKVGQQIYVTGNKGYSKGDHLHIQLKKNGVLKDPTKYILNDKPTEPVVTPPTPPVAPQEPPSAPETTEEVEVPKDTIIEKLKEFTNMQLLSELLRRFFGKSE